MTGYLRRNPMIVFLGVLAAVLAAILLIELATLRGGAAASSARRAAAADAKLLPPVPAVVPEQAYPETTARPIFIATRRPAPDAVTVAAPAFQRGQFTLQGVIVTGQARTAMLREKTSGRTHRVETGGEVNGVKVVQIDPTQVVLGMGDEREVVPLTVQRPGAPAAPGQAAAPPAAAITQGPFAPQAAPAPAPVPSGIPGQPAGGSGLARFPQPGQPVPPGQPGSPVAPAPATTAAPGVNPPAPAAPMSAEELLARRRARRGQQTE